jgi:hypothetical protein
VGNRMVANVDVFGGVKATMSQASHSINKAGD